MTIKAHNITGSAVDDEAQKSGLQGKMNALEVVFTVMAYNAPALAFMGFLPVMILMGNGLGTPVLHIAVGILIFIIATGLMKVSNALKRSGGFYSFTTAGLGKEAGLSTGFTSMITYFAAMTANYVLAGIAFSDFVSGVFNGPEIPWPVGTVIVFVAVSALGYLNISFSSKALLIFLGLELVLIATYCVAVFVQGGAEGISFDSFKPEHILSGSIAVGGLFAVGLFGGFEATVIFRDEVKNPDRTIPRATYGVVTLITVLYAVAAFALINGYGAGIIMEVLANDVVTVSGESIRTYVGDFAYNAAIVLLFTSAFAGALAGHNVLARYVFNMAADGVFPKTLSSTHSKHGSPYKASVIASVAALIILVVLGVLLFQNNNLYGYIAGVYSYGMLILITTVSFGIGVFLLRKLKGNRLHAIVMFAVAALMLVILVFASFRFDLLSGMTGALGVTVLAIIWLLIASGAVIASIYKRKKADVYAHIGRE